MYRCKHESQNVPWHPPWPSFESSPHDCTWCCPVCHSSNPCSKSPVWEQCKDNQEWEDCTDKQWQEVNSVHNKLLPLPVDQEDQSSSISGTVGQTCLQRSRGSAIALDGENSARTPLLSLDITVEDNAWCEYMQWVRLITQA